MKFLPFTILSRRKVAESRKQIQSLQRQIQVAQSFIKEIERGNLSIELQRLEGDDEKADILAASLVSMRDQMSKIAEQERRRNWITEGLAKFVDILRSKNDDLNTLGEAIISNIVRYMDANQGSLFILNDDDKTDVHLEMIACYAYNRKKHLNQKIGLGQGLTGQAVLEKETVYMTNIPDNYLKITSGLGEALPKNLMIVPLILNNAVFGVIELASFQTFDTHHREFIEKLAESIASTISNVRVNQQTRKLLAETQEQAEQMRSQEEEMRQNMEELTATQEEIQRVLQEVQAKEGYMNQLLNVSADPIFTFDQNLKLVTWNQAFESTVGGFHLTMQKGMNIMDLYEGKDRAAQIETYRRALRGEIFETTTSIESSGSTTFLLTIYAPLQNEQGEIQEAAAFVKDVTSMMAAQRSAEKLASDAQHQAEELKAQEEELRQNMEELSATQDEMQRIMKTLETREQYMTQLLNATEDMFFTIDREYTLVSWNKSFETSLAAFGTSIQKGMNTLDWYPNPTERLEQKTKYDRVLSGESFDEVRITTVNDRTFYFQNISKPLRNEEGEVYEAVIFARDITATEHARIAGSKNPQQEESGSDLIQEIINNCHYEIYAVDKEFKYLNFSESVKTSLQAAGISIERGSDALAIIPDKKEREAMKKQLERVFKGEVFDQVREFTFKGSSKHVFIHYKPIRNSRNEIIAAGIYSEDITELMTIRKINNELLQQVRSQN